MCDKMATSAYILKIVENNPVFNSVIDDFLYQWLIIYIADVIV